MPLRVTKEYSVDDQNNGKKVHRKMSKNGHYQKVRRPTGLEVYNDAANILEQLLEKRIDRAAKTARQRRNQTDPTKQRESSATNGSEVTVARCKTMPSRYRESIDDDTKRKELEDHREEQRKILKKGSAVNDESDSTANAESDGEDSNVTKNRKKKSLFKRAKENLIRTFQRDQKDGFGQKEDKKEATHTKKKRKVKKRSDSVVRERKRNLKGHLNEDKSIDYTETVDYRQSNIGSNSESLSRKSRTGSMSRNSLMDAIRKPFRKSHRRGENLDDDEKNKLHGEKRSFVIKDDDSGAHPSSPSHHRHRDDSSTPSPPSLIQFECGNDLDMRKESSRSAPSSNSKSPPMSEVIHFEGGRGGTLSSTTSTAYPTSDYNNSLGSLSGLPNMAHNILDEPGEDIKFMDEDEDDKEKRKSMIKYYGSQGLLTLQWLAEQTANAKTLDFEIDQRSVSTILPDGHMETTTTVTTTRTVVLPEVEEEVNESDEQDGNEKPVVKEEMYGKIAQKLLEIADTYGSLSDEEGRDGAESSAIADAPLTDLEKEIIACLRSGGDKYGKKMEEHLDALKTAVNDDAYDRFRITIDNTMGQELSWNTLALLYHATKGVVGAVGKSSQAAVQAKEFTMKYISDTFVSWIMEQGGFDSMLSASETDPELD